MAWQLANIYHYKQGLYAKPNRPPFAESDVYIGRGGKGLEQSILHNPFVFLDTTSRYSNVYRVPDPIRAYRLYLVKECTVAPDGLVAQEIRQLAERKNVTLLCFCSPKPCHGQIILNAIQWQQRTKAISFIIPETSTMAQEDYEAMRAWRIEAIAEAMKGTSNGKA